MGQLFVCRNTEEKRKKKKRKKKKRKKEEKKEKKEDINRTPNIISLLCSVHASVKSIIF